MAEPRKAHFHTLGCKLNFAETAAVERLFHDQGILTADISREAPDIVFVNSCSVTEEADRKCRRLIRSFHNRWPRASIIVTGCYAQLKPAEVAALPGVAVVAGTNDKLQVLRFLDQNVQGDSIPAPREAAALRSFMPSCSRGDRTRYFLKVQDGCDYWCSFCTIPMARGRSRSGSIASLVDMARQVAREGGKEIVLTGVNIGDFGKGSAESFFDLIKALDRVDGIERFRISSIEPNLLTDEIIDFVASSRSFMPHFHVPLQSGSDAVLKLMRRRYDTDFFARKIERIRQAIPHAFIGADIMVGARGETAQEFDRSADFVRSIDISHLHVFPYSERPGTRALSLDAYAPSQQEKKARVKILMDISAQKHADFARCFIGSSRPVLVESKNSGFTDNYLRVHLAHPAPENSIAPVFLKSLNPNGESLTGLISLS